MKKIKVKELDANDVIIAEYFVYPNTWINTKYLGQQQINNFTEKEKTIHIEERLIEGKLKLEKI